MLTTRENCLALALTCKQQHSASAGQTQEMTVLALPTYQLNKYRDKKFKKHQQSTNENSKRNI